MVADETGEVIQEFGLGEKVIAITVVDNTANMEVAIRQLQIRNLGCFAHALNLAAQNVSLQHPIYLQVVGKNEGCHCMDKKIIHYEEHL